MGNKKKFIFQSTKLLNYYISHVIWIIIPIPLLFSLCMRAIFLLRLSFLFIFELDEAVADSVLNSLDLVVSEAIFLESVALVHLVCLAAARVALQFKVVAELEHHAEGE